MRRFSNSMFPSVRSSRATGEDAELSRALARYLATAPINERTNDDKTLILASAPMSTAASCRRRWRGASAQARAQASGKAGEGAVFELEGEPGMAAKIHHQP